MTTVTVPCSMPVGTGLKPAAVTRLTTSSGTAVVATSISAIGMPMQRIAHRAADHARLLAVAVEHAEQARQRARAQPRRAGEPARGRAGRHLVCPGTNLPFSICAGT